nr:zinc finger, CCHC-type [Tanacetum cinerariifolium]
MANLSDDIQCAGSDHDHYQEAACAHHEDHMMHDSVQLDHVVDSHADYMSDSNIILYDQYVKDNEVPVVHSDVSFIPTDAFMMIYDDMCEPHNQSVSYPSRNTAVQNSLTAELATYKEHVELYEQWAKFELTEREQKINEQLSHVISDRNFKEETLKRELHSIKLQLTSTINHNKSMVAIGYKNPLCLTRAKQVQPALYNGHEIIKDNHTPAIVHNSKDTLEIAEITRKKMNDKMNDPECVTRKVKIAPHDYSKENLLATFTPHKQLTPEQIFWSNDLMKLKSEALKERTKMTTSVGNNSVFRSFFEKQKLTGPNFIDWYRQLRLVLSIENKKNYLEHPIPAAPVAPPGQQVPLAALAAHSAWVKGQKEELKAMYSKQAEQELLQTMREFHTCKQAKCQSVSSHVLKMKGYIENLERLGQPVGQNLAVSLILVSLNKDFDNFVQNYNMHGMGKTVNELHAMLKLHEETLLKKDVNPALHAIRAGR